MLTLLGGFGLTLIGVYATAWGVSTSQDFPTPGRVVPGLLAIVVGVKLVVAPVFQTFQQSLPLVILVFVAELGITFAVYRALLHDGRADRIANLGRR